MGLFLGLDSSTQGLTALVVDTARGEVVHQDVLNYGAEFPEYGSPQGFLPHADPLVRHADPRLWVAALERLLGRLRAAGLAARLDGLSGSAQQHGTVYLTGSFPAAPDPGESLAACVGRSLARPTAPIWMDASTAAECRQIEAALGGADEVRRRTGSAAVERFAGPQIRRFAVTEPAAYERTGVIHLVSSFLASVLTGVNAPIDPGDGAGMNLLNLSTGAWDGDLVSATAPGLSGRLPGLCSAGAVCGPVAPWLVERFGLRPGTPVVAWSGDNPSSLIGVGGWEPGTMAISLGTSDTCFAAMRAPRVDPEGCGHVFGNPAGGFMCLICFRNGSLAREHIRDLHGLTWRQFDGDCLAATPPGNGGNLMLPYVVPEITPRVLSPGLRRRGAATFEAGGDAAGDVRAIVEAQALSLRLHSQWIGEAPTALRLTGGASRSDGIGQILADVFQAEVERLDVGNSAALGAALRAAQAVEGLPWAALAARFCAPVAGRRLHPVAANAALYRDLLKRYAALEASCRADEASPPGR
ncbi:MAG: carbohydrate kinase [Lentisphaerae bacterium]|nr:carbohydrate kinase [Lentisphaerota bacterium]